MKQGSLSLTGYFDKGKKIRREQFLAEMNQVVPWSHGRTSISDGQAFVGSCEGALPKNQEEPCADAYADCIGKRVPGATAVDEYVAAVRP